MTLDHRSHGVRSASLIPKCSRAPAGVFRRGDAVLVISLSSRGFVELHFDASFAKDLRSDLEARGPTSLVVR